MSKRKLEQQAEELIAYKLITSTTGSISDRAKRKYEKVGEEAAERLKNRDSLPEDSNLVISLGWSDESASWARKINLAIEEFKQTYPDQGKILQEIIDKHRSFRRGYIQFGVKQGELPKDVYTSAVQSIFPDASAEEAEKFYEFVTLSNRLLKKKAEGLQKIILPE